MHKVFLSYRREDSEAETRNILLSLQRLGNEDVFMDRTSLEPGSRWPDKIRDALERATIVLVIIGPRWLTSLSQDGRRRIDSKEDWVHLELKIAIEKNKTIVPVLVNGAKMPSAMSLPDNLSEITNRQAVRLHQESWDNDILSVLRKIQIPFLRIPTILLTSESPRRKELLAQIGWLEGQDYYATHASVNLEIGSQGEKEIKLSTVKEVVERTARDKIEYVVRHMFDIHAKIGKTPSLSETIVIGVDTVVFCKNEILDRPLLKALEFAGPNDIEQARQRAKEMLMRQRGENIHIVTSIAVALASDPQNAVVKTVVTEATLRDFTEDDIDQYISYAEPFDKAGAFGIQEKGVSLFKGIKGSYTNIVGLPLREFIALLNANFGSLFAIPPQKSMLGTHYDGPSRTELSALCVGDINYDYVYDKLPGNFFINLQPPGEKIKGEIYRGAGGTAVNFAKGAKAAGFKTCFVVGVVGGDALGQEIEKELYRNNIKPLLPSDPAQRTSIALILRNHTKADTSITLTDSHQSLPDLVVERARGDIERSDVFYCSGYCLDDQNRKPNALQMLQIARKTKRLVVLDVVAGMNRGLIDELARSRLVDVLISKLPEVFTWMNLDFENKNEIDVWENYKIAIVTRLRESFPVVILRASNFTQEMIVTPNDVIMTSELDYSWEAHNKVGYGDFRTARQIHSFLSPRILLASQSPQRLQLLRQIVAPEKIETQASNYDENSLESNHPQERVRELALAKAQAVFDRGNFSNSIEFILGADTEIICRDGTSRQWKLVGHPQTQDEAKRDLVYLAGKTHTALTGIAIIGRDLETGEIKTVIDSVVTKVTFADLNEEQIDSYVSTGEPLNRAGAYAIQGLGDLLVEGIDGSYSNIVGLPLERLSEILANDFNRPIWMFDKASNWMFPQTIKGAKLL